MAKRSPLAAARGALLSMVLLMVVMAAGIFGTTYAGGSWAPKLALDLSGGTQMILSPRSMALRMGRHPGAVEPGG